MAYADYQADYLQHIDTRAVDAPISVPDRTSSHRYHHWHDYVDYYQYHPIVQRGDMIYQRYAEQGYDAHQNYDAVKGYEKNLSTTCIYDSRYLNKPMGGEVTSMPVVKEMYSKSSEKLEIKKKMSFVIPNLGSEEILVRPDDAPNDRDRAVFKTAEKPFESQTPPMHQRMDWEQYHRLGVIHSFMEDLEREFPSLCTTGVIGRSLEGRDIKILKISNSDAANQAVWIDAGIHAREWIGPAVNTFVADYIARNFFSLPVSISNKDWYFLPVMNPDGYEHTHTTSRMWRKNKAWHGGQLCGVDLNRNFSFGWGGKGSSDVPSSCFYRGPAPFSEPESYSVREFILNSGAVFKVYITLHSFGEVIIFPFASRNELCPDYIRLLQGATVMSKAIYATNGTTYKVGISKDVMYIASGTSNDWCYGGVGIPYCYLIELRSKKHKFKLPQEEIEETAQEILNCVIALMDFVEKTPLEGKSEEKNA